MSMASSGTGKSVARSAVMLAIMLVVVAGSAACTSGSAPVVRDVAPAGAPAWLLGAFEDDYGIRYAITASEWRQQPNARYEVVRWNPDGQYLIARNAATNRADPGKWTRIDWMALPGMPPYAWAFCMSAYAAPSAEAAERTTLAKRDQPRTGCNGYPFSRMRLVTGTGR